MVDIVALLHCTRPHVTATTVRQLSRIIVALLTMTGRVTMVGMARWAGKGGSYRTIQRLFATLIPWAILFWVFFRHHLYCPGDVYLVAGDDVIVTKAGTCTHGLDRFFASLYGKPVPGLAFFPLPLVSVQARRAFPLRVEQVVRSDAEKAARVMLQMCTLWLHTGSPNSWRLTNNPMTMSCIWIDREKQIVLRVSRLIRVRKVKCLRSICCVFRLPGWCSSGSRCRVYAPQ